jgi:hypothetical protein
MQQLKVTMDAAPPSRIRGSKTPPKGLSSAAASVDSESDTDDESTSEDDDTSSEGDSESSEEESSEADSSSEESSSEEEEEEEEAVVDVNDPDALAVHCLLMGLHSISDSQLPMAADKFYAQHILPGKPEGAVLHCPSSRRCLALQTMLVIQDSFLMHKVSIRYL